MIIKCIVCSKGFKTFPSRVKKYNTRFCSRKCKFIGLQDRVFVNCELCKKEFWYPPSKKQRFCSHSCHASSQIAEKHSSFKGELVMRGGYRWIYIRLTTNDTKPLPSRRKLCHVVAERKLGRYLRNGELIHHINGNKLDDRPENLYLTTREKHMTLHKQSREGIVIKSNL